MGFNDSYNVSEIEFSFIVSNNAPNKALVAGGYFIAKRTKVFLSLSDNVLRMANIRLQEVSILLSGIFLM